MDTAAFYPGTFDPITNGHLDIIARAEKIFGEVVVAVIDVPAHKGKTLFSTEERMELIAANVSNSVKVIPFQRLAVEEAAAAGCLTMVRGLRAVSDFEYELAINNLNHHQNPAVDTIYLMAQPEHSFVSSSGCRELAKFSGKLEGLVPANVENALRKKFEAPQ